MDFRIDAAHTGSQRASFINRALARKWSRALNGSISYPLVADGRVFVTVSSTGGHGSALYALNEHTGAIIWGPADVFTASGMGTVYAIDLTTGAVVATINLGVSIAATDEHNAVQRTGIAVGDGLLLVPAGNSLFAY
ncbi:MAG TPA: PQQ-binding-like beta-propeller repeat protein [Candidatus Dormibacteraeota bacterium]